MSYSPDKPVVEVYLGDLYGQAATAEDLETVQAWEAEYQAERASTLSRSVGRSSVMAEAAGTVVPLEEVVGQPVEGAYAHNRRA